MGLECMIVLAHAFGRTLVVPPQQHLYLLGQTHKGPYFALKLLLGYCSDKCSCLLCFFCVFLCFSVYFFIDLSFIVRTLTVPPQKHPDLLEQTREGAR